MIVAAGGPPNWFRLYYLMWCRSSVRCVNMNKMCSRSVKDVVCAWANTSAPSASFLMTRFDSPFMPLHIMGLVCDSSLHVIYVCFWLGLFLKHLCISCRLRSFNTTATSVEFAEQEDKKITSIVIVAAAAIQWPCRRDTRVSKSRCTKTVLFAWRCVALHPCHQACVPCPWQL